VEEIANGILKHIGAFQEGDLKEVCSRIFIKYVLEEPDMTPEKKVLPGLMKAAQDASDGSFDKLHTFGLAIRALNIAGMKPARPFAFLNEWNKPAALEEFVRSLDWKNPWQTSIEVLHAATPQMRVWLMKGIDATEFFEALEEFQAPNGGWGDASDLHQMAGAFHHIPIYRAARREMPRLVVLADMIMDLEFKRMEFGAMDAAYVLEYAYEQRAVKFEECGGFLEHMEGLLRSGLEKMAEPGALTLVPFAQTLGTLCRMKQLHQYKDAWHPNLWRAQF